MSNTDLHTFHIPVMGLAYTIDSPVKVARYGINSVVSIIEDKLIELMRKYYYGKMELPYKPITTKEEDYRAKRITDYLNLLHKIVKDQIEKLRHSAFSAGSDISKYFEMLPDNNALRLTYQRMIYTDCPHEKEKLSSFLKNQIRPGRIDVNIMTKVDKNNYDRNQNLLTDSSDAVAALRGYANSELTNSSIIFSAGLNPRLFNYLEKLPSFHAKGFGEFDKRVAIKVSDYRSALIQGKFLAKKGIWVSEFRIESGLNCGGHAFATNGSLLGPILEEFKSKKEELTTTLHSIFQPAAKAKNLKTFDEPQPINITVQGGIGTHEEADFLRIRYGIDSTGWGTPFLLCPEATTVDEKTLTLLQQADEEKIILSKNSPLGVRFNYLKGTTAEKEKLARIDSGRPGSPCTEKHLVSNVEFTKEPICTASHTYQKKKIEQLKTLDLSIKEYERQYREVVNKECLCIGLSNAAIVKYDLPAIKNLTAVTICPGPNIAYFSKIVTLQEMTDHIYGRTSLIDGNRPHMFIKELKLNIDYLEEQVSEFKEDSHSRNVKDALTFAKQLINGIEYYRTISHSITNKAFLPQLNALETKVKNMTENLLSIIS